MSLIVFVTSTHADNIHLYDDGPLRRLQVFSDSNKKLTHVPAGGCTQTLTTNTTGSIIHVISSAAGSAVQLCVQDTSGNKFYLRVNTAQNNNVQLVCQSYVDSVSRLRMHVHLIRIRRKKLVYNVR